MNARTHTKYTPLISTTMAGIAFFIHVILSIINFNFTALVNDIPLHQSNVNTLIMAIIQPLAVAVIVAPVLSTIRNSDFITEFRNILFLAVGLFVVYALADMSGLLS
jgi:hypothetical protein